MLLAASLVQGQTNPPAAPAAPKDPAPESPYIEDGGISVEPFYWLTSSRPKVRDGKLTAASDKPGNFDFPGKAKGAYGLVASFPAGRQNSLRITYFRSKGSADTVLANDMNLFTVGYLAQDRLFTDYTVQHAKVSLDFLSYTFQNNVRFKTMWGGQATMVEGNVDAPLRAADTGILFGTSKKWLFYPSFGVGFGQAASKHFRWEAQASGFGIPKRGAQWDADGAAVIRLGRAEILGGYKVFSVKTSPRDDLYFRQRLSGPYVGLRWYFERMK